MKTGKKQGSQRLSRSYKRAILRLLAALTLPISFHVLAQSKATIRGTIVDQDTQRPIPLVNVVVRDTPYGATTDTHGRFEINNIVADIYVIEFSHVAYKKRIHVLEKAQGDTITFSIELQEEPVPLPEISITAKQSESDRLFQPYASTIITSEQINRTGATRLTQVLRSFEPGIIYSISPRMGRRISSHERVPFLIFLDGAYVQYIPGSLDHIIDVHQIERIEVSRWVGASPNLGPGTSDRIIQIFTKQPRVK